MSAELRVESLASTGRLQVDDICCRSDASSLGPEEGDSAPRLVLPLRGVFQLEATGEQHIVEPGCVVVLAPDAPYRFGHPANGGDDCLRIALHAELLAEILESLCLPDDAAMPVRRPLSGPQIYRNTVFRRSAAVADAGAVEELAMLRVQALVGEVAAAAPPWPPSTRVSRTRQVLVEGASAFVAAVYHERVPNLLDRTAAAVHCSPFHLARLFRYETGVTLHQFRERLRCMHALEHLADSSGGLVRLAHDLGYASHSHFTAAFRRQCGVTPSQARTALRQSRPSKVRKIVTA